MIKERYAEIRESCGLETDIEKIIDDTFAGIGKSTSVDFIASRGEYFCALLMAEIAPMRADTIFARGWMYGESRVIAGAHWQSDVDASRVAASIAYCALQGSDAFRRQMKRAQAEYLVKAGQSTDMQRATIIDKEKPSARSYRPDGVRSSDSSKGVTIERQHKVLRR